jgi:hypothetical protein
VRDVTNPLPNAHGVIDRTRFFGARTVTAKITSWDDGNLPFDEITRQFAPFLDVGARPQLHYTTMGNQTERVLPLRATTWSAPMDPPHENQFQAQWIAPDPVASGALTNSATAWSGSSGGSGRTYDFAPNRIYPNDSGSPVTAVLQSNGEIGFQPLLTIFGPIQGAQVKLVTDSGTTFFVPTLPQARIDGGHYVVIDTHLHTALYDGVTPWLNNIDWTQMLWPVLPVLPDETTMSLLGINCTTLTQVVAQWQDRYLL